MSYTATDNYEDADILLLNTCAIRENVHNKVFGMLGRIKHLKGKTKYNSWTSWLYVTRRSSCRKILKKYKWMDFVIELIICIAYHK